MVLALRQLAWLSPIFSSENSVDIMTGVVVKQPAHFVPKKTDVLSRSPHPPFTEIHHPEKRR